MEHTGIEDKRRMLLHMAAGGQQYYCIEYCVDIKGNITIFGGNVLRDTYTHDMLICVPTEDYIWLYDNQRSGRDFANREHEAARNVSRDDLVAAYLEFRAQHPHDGYGNLNYKLCHLAGVPVDMPADRSDIDAVRLELKRRNRQYIAELYGKQLPLDYDFLTEYKSTTAGQQNPAPTDTHYMVNHKTIKP